MNDKLMELIGMMTAELDETNLASITLTKIEGEWSIELPVASPWLKARCLGPIERQLIEAIREVKIESEVVNEEESSPYDLAIDGTPLRISPRLKGGLFMERPIYKWKKGNFLSVFNGIGWDVFTPREIKAIGDKFGFEIGIRHIYSNRAKHKKKIKK